MAKIICKDHLGNVYPSITKMCNFYGINIYVYKSRKNLGWSLEKILTTPIGAIIPKAKQVTDHLGNVYPSITKMCEVYGISKNLYKNRKKQGWTLEHILTTPNLGLNHQAKQVTDHLGNVYPSITKMCEVYGISKNLYKNRKDIGWSLEHILTTPTLGITHSAKQVTDHLGNVFSSIHEMCEFYGIPYNVYTIRMHIGWSKEKSLTTPNGGKSFNAKQVTDHLGNVFPSIKEMCKFYNISHSLYWGRKKRGWTLQETLTVPKHLYIGEYRVSECLKRLNVKYYHDCSIKTIFEDLNIAINWVEFLTELQKHLDSAGYTWSKQKIQRLRPDFVLYTDEDNTIKGVIEFDGEQHQNFVEYFFKTIEEFYRRSNADFVKQSFWEYMNIPMLRIRHDQLDNIDEMVTDFIENPKNYITNHNTYLSEDEYWSILIEQKEKLELAFA